MEINNALGHSNRPCTFGHLILCTLGVFGIAGRLIDARYHDIENKFQLHQDTEHYLESSSVSALPLISSRKGKENI